MAATSNTTIKPQNLPPTECAAFYHCLRVHLQVIQWKLLLQTNLQPTDWGWKLNQGRYDPIMTDLDAAPGNILKFVRCKCKVSSKNTCGTNNCLCRRNGLKCVVACGDCRGQQCNNAEERNDEEAELYESDIDDGNIFEQLEHF